MAGVPFRMPPALGQGHKKGRNRKKFLSRQQAIAARAGLIARIHKKYTR